jgi:N-acetylneuraminic acid mutarotase
MLLEKSFFSAVSTHGGTRIYTFGGYECIEKVQLKSCEFYSVLEDKWFINDQVQLNVARSQSSCCLFNESVIFIFGGYNKQLGTLNTIERFDLKLNKIQLLDIKLIIPLRRFAACKISS